MKQLLISIILTIAAPAAMAQDVAVEKVLAPYASAQSIVILEEDTEMLRSSDPAEIMRAAAASCLLTPKDRKSIIAKLKYAGWKIYGSNDEQWVEADFNQVWVLLLGTNNEFACNISGNIPQNTALEVTKDLLITAEWGGWTVIPEGGECYKITHPENLIIYISSAGNDPVCSLTSDSTISIVAPWN